MDLCNMCKCDVTCILYGNCAFLAKLRPARNAKRSMLHSVKQTNHMQAVLVMWSLFLDFYIVAKKQ